MTHLSSMPVSRNLPGSRTSQDTEAGRREAIVSATWRVIAASGVSAASLRTIASEMHATTGLITRYFPEKPALMLVALEQAVGFLCSEVEGRAAPRAHAARLEAVVRSSLPDTAEKLSAWKVWVAFMGELPGHPDLGEAHARFPASIRRELIAEIREAQLAGGIAPEIYPPQMADSLVSQIIGLGVRAVTEPARYPAGRLAEFIAPYFFRMVQTPG